MNLDNLGDRYELTPLPGRFERPNKHWVDKLRLFYPNSDLIVGVLKLLSVGETHMCKNTLHSQHRPHNASLELHKCIKCMDSRNIRRYITILCQIKAPHLTLQRTGTYLAFHVVYFRCLRRYSSLTDNFIPFQFFPLLFLDINKSFRKPCRQSIC